jgi:hypothetical protein
VQLQIMHFLKVGERSSYHLFSEIDPLVQKTKLFTPSLIFLFQIPKFSAA